MARLFRILYAVACVGAMLQMTACSTTRIVKPLDAKQAAIGADFGGALIDFGGMVIPLPFTSVTAAYGVDSTSTIFGSVHTTSLAFGVVQLEGGAVINVLRRSRNGFNVSVSPVLNSMISTYTGEARFYPELVANAHWTYGKHRRNFMYASVASWFDFYRTGAYGRVNTETVLPTFALGHTFVTPKRKMRYTLEARWLAPFTNNQNTVVGYNSFGNQGALGVYFSAYYCF